MSAGLASLQSTTHPEIQSHEAILVLKPVAAPTVALSGLAEDQSIPEAPSPLPGFTHPHGSLSESAYRRPPCWSLLIGDSGKLGNEHPG